MYVGKLASLVGLHDLAEEHLLVALEIATEFGWTYHREPRCSRLRRHDTAASARSTRKRAWLTEASDLRRAGSFRSWIPAIDVVAAGSPRR